MLSGGTGLPNDPVVVITNVSVLNPTTYLVQFRTQRAGSVTFSVYREGTLLKSVPSTATGTGQIVLTIADGDSPYFEILDDPNQKPHPAYPGHLSLNWRLIGGASTYEVQEYLSGSWSTEITIAEDGSNNHIFLTRWLEDSETHQFQVVPIDSTGNAGTPISYSSETVRHPDAPDVDYTFVPLTAQVTITAA